KLQGYDVFEPIGYDAFGIHSENYAIQVNRTPQDVIGENVKNFEKQLKRIGNMFDWSRAVTTYDPEYYKWTQWIFLKLYEKGLAYKSKAPVNWCPSCKTVLADEQVEQGLCERCDSEVSQKDLEQWFIKITDYAQRLLDGHDDIEWSQKTILAQKNWIGRSEGMQVNFKVKDSDVEVPVFTTRPDTLFGVTYIVLAPEHPLVEELVSKDRLKEVQEYILAANKLSNIERTTEGREKTGVPLGATAINPVNDEEIPIWIADYALASYGTGAVMAVPAHDQRDFEFAQIYNLPIKQVIKSVNDFEDGADEGEGIMMDSGEYDGMPSADFRTQIMKAGKAGKWGEAKTNYKLRDWLISRQRYWGPPIPIIYCDKCGTVPVPEEDLPVKLPKLEDFKPSGSGKSPLADVDKFVNTKCPKCGGKAQRETDVTDTFLDSAWYFLRYPSTDFKDVAWDKKRTKKWLPVSQYTGGNEHAVLHLMYTRFLTMFFHDEKLLDFAEPFPKFFAHGLIIKDGAKMSKSRGNVIVPDEYLDQYGTDVLRTYLMFIGPYKDGGDFRDSGIVGITRFFQKIAKGLAEWKDTKQKADDQLEQARHTLLKNASEDFEDYSFNTVISGLMEYFNPLPKDISKVTKEQWETLAIVLAPLAPHLAEEIWQTIGNTDSIFRAIWPKYDAKILETQNIDLIVQVNGKLRATLSTAKDITQADAETLAKEHENVVQNLEGKEVVKVIFVPGRLINFVVK
ncbi:leucine--tRNA ligase, partial [Patescibacteria group bacterium]